MNASQQINDLNSPQVSVRRQAAEELARCPDASAAVSLIRACGDADEPVRQWAAAALEETGAPDAADVAALADLLDAAQGDVRYWSATLLGRLGERAASALGPLSRALDGDPDVAVRQRAAWAMGQMGRSAVAAKEVLTRATCGGDARLTRLAHEALKKIEGS